MERMEEYQRMREEEADRPVPAELACLETRVRARRRSGRGGEEDRSWRLYACVWSWGPAWPGAWAVSPRWTGCWGKTRDS